MSLLAVTPAVQRRITATLFTAQSLFSAATIAAFTMTPIVAAAITGSEALAGVPSTVLMLGRAAASYPLGWLMDKTGRRVGLSVGFFIGVLGLLASTIAVQYGSFLVLCIGSILIGMGRAASEQTRFAAADAYEPSARARAIGTVVFAGTIGAIGGPLLVGPASALMGGAGYNPDAGPYAFSTLILLLALGLLIIFLRPDPKDIAAQLDAEDARVNHKTVVDTGERGLRVLWPILRRDMVMLSLVAMVIGQLVMSLIMVITPLHMRHYDHSNDAIAWVIAAHNLGMFGLSNFTGWLIDRLGRIPMILVGGIVLVIASAMTPLSPTFTVLATALFLLGLGWNFAFIAASSLLSDALEPHERGRIQGVSETMVALAAGLSSLGTGGAFALGGIVAVAAVGLAFSLVLIVVAFWYNRSQSLVGAGKSTGD
ncbi:MFS transporter [bacterium]|nr:MFS transporter [bacterium]